jgi:tRNA (guanine-N7-)-methyltransferase
MQMLAVLDACGTLANSVPGGGFLDAGPVRTATRFERRGERLGHQVRELLYQRL